VSHAGLLAGSLHLRICMTMCVDDSEASCFRGLRHVCPFVDVSEAQVGRPCCRSARMQGSEWGVCRSAQGALGSGCAGRQLEGV
jgi:hypothetical protein